MEGSRLDKLNIITTISSGSRTNLYLVADDAGALFVYKKIKGADRTEIYQKISESNAKCFPKIIEMCYRDETTHVLEEYIEGKDLGSLLKDEADGEDCTEYPNKIDFKKAVSISRQLMQAVAILHGMNPPIIHRDIKPENILITDDDKLYLIDFDATREYSEGKRAQDTVLLGTRGYAAPEQFGFNQTEVRSDIYSIGVVCTQIFEKTDATPEQKARLKTCFSKASMFDPSDRYADIGEMLKAFEHAAAPEKYERKHKRKPIYIAVICALIAIAALIIILGLKAYDHSKEPVYANTQVVDMDIIPPEYTYKAILQELIKNGGTYSGATRQVSEANVNTINDQDSKNIVIDPIKTDTSDTDDLYSETQECSIGTEYPLLRFIKDYPQAILFYDPWMEENTIKSVEFVRYSENGQRKMDRIRMTHGDYILKDGIFCLKAGTLKKLQQGIYELHIITERGEDFAYYLKIHDSGEKTDNLAVRAIRPVQYYSSSIKNDVIFTIYNTPYAIKGILCNDEKLSEHDYILTLDGRGAIFQEELLERYKDEDRLEIVFEMENGRKAYGAIVMLREQ